MRHEINEQPLLPFPPPYVVKDVLGRERFPQGTIWPDGSYNCPFCWAAVLAERGGRCENPQCVARPGFPIAEAERRVREADERAAEEARREQANTWREERRVEEEKERALARGTLLAECEKHDYCQRCALKDFPFRTKKIKHRKGCPFERH